jgi:hypothetical protein
MNRPYAVPFLKRITSRFEYCAATGATNEID